MLPQTNLAESDVHGHKTLPKYRSVYTGLEQIRVSIKAAGLHVSFVFDSYTVKISGVLPAM